MCPICWISGFIAVLFGGSFIAVVNHPISWIIGFALIIYSVFKFYEAKKRGKKMTEETKQRNKKTIFRFVQGIVIGSIMTIIVFYGLTYKEHEKMHQLLKKQGANVELHLYNGKHKIGVESIRKIREIIQS